MERMAIDNSIEESINEILPGVSQFEEIIITRKK